MTELEAGLRGLELRLNEFTKFPNQTGRYIKWAMWHRIDEPVMSGENFTGFLRTTCGLEGPAYAETVSIIGSGEICPYCLHDKPFDYDGKFSNTAGMMGQ